MNDIDTETNIGISMYGFSSEKAWLAWQRKRRNSIIGFVIVGTIAGLDSTLIESSLYLYLRDSMRTETPKIWYGVITAAFFMFYAASASLCGRWLDQTRKVVRYINFSLSIQFIGFLIYAIPYHAGIVLFGRILCGIGSPFVSVVTGEVYRIYPVKEAMRAQLWLASGFSFGFIIAPAVGAIFTSVHFDVGLIEFNQLNFIALFMCLCILVTMVITNLIVSDCSYEFDLKAYLSRQQNDDNEQIHNVVFSGNGPSEQDALLSTPRCVQQQIPVKTILKKFILDADTAILFISSCTLSYAFEFTVGILPLVVTGTLNWGVKSMNLLFTLNGVGSLFALIGMAYYCKTDKAIYYTSLVSIASQAIALIIYLVFSLVQRHYQTDVVLMILLMLTAILSVMFEMALVSVMLAKRVPSGMQSFSEGVRTVMSMTGLVFGALSIPYEFEYLAETSIALMILSFATMAVFLFRRQSLLYPKEIEF